MLQTMQQPAATEPSSTFASVLAALTAPGQKRAPARDLDGLEDDVATLTYERAVRAHSRFRTPEPGLHAVPQPADSEVLSIHEVFPADLEPASEAAPARTVWAANPEPQPPHDTSNARDRNLKCASITVRLSKEECAQLRRRAVEAGLTISAYLRSCSVEAESLRAQVKDTLAQMRAESPQENQVPAPRGSGRSIGWLRRLLSPRDHARRSIAQA
jgi:hypothetical protein